MIILWSFLIVFSTILLVILLTSSQVHVLYDKKLSVELSSLNGLIKTELIPNRKKKKPKAAHKEKPKKENNTSVEEKIENLLDILSLYSEMATDIRTQFRFETFDFLLSFGTTDAATTAILSGIAWSGIYQMLGFIDTVFMLEELRVAVKPDFEQTGFYVYLDTTFKVNHAHLLRIALIASIKYIKRSKSK